MYTEFLGFDRLRGFCRADLNGEDDCGCLMLVTFISTLRPGKSIPFAELPSS